MDYTSWLEKSIDPSIQLAVKGPLSQLCYFFKKGDNGETSITTRPFASPPDALVPIILPDYSSDYYKNSKQNDTSTNGGKNSDDEVPIVNEIYHSNNLEETEQDEEVNVANKKDHNTNNALGLKAFYLVNTEHKLDFRISKGVLDPADLKVADFADDETRAHLPYNYGKHILHTKDYTAEHKNQINKWLNQKMPTPPESNKGFQAGAAASYASSYASDKNGLQRLVELSKEVRRLDPSAYNNSQQKVSFVESTLETIRHRPMACNSENANQSSINRWQREQTIINWLKRQKFKSICYKKKRSEKQKERSEKLRKLPNLLKLPKLEEQQVL